jgi:hypothetical protein
MISEGDKAEQMVKNQFDHTDAKAPEEGIFQYLS